MASRRLTDIKDFPFIHRCCCSVWSGHPHCIHSGHSVRADRSDLTHPACDDRCDPGQRRGPGAPTIAVRLHHSHQEAPLSAWAGDGTSWVSLLMLMLLSSFAVILHLFHFFYSISSSSSFRLSSRSFPSLMFAGVSLTSIFSSMFQEV